MDTHASFLTYIWNLLTTDSDLQTAMGGTVRLYSDWAQPDAAFPYMVHRMSIGTSEPFPMRQATYYIDIWTDEDGRDGLSNIRERLIELLDETEPNTTEIKAARLWLQAEDDGPEIEQYIWHYAMQFNLRYYRASEVNSILSR